MTQCSAVRNSPIQEYLQEVYDRYAGFNEGNVATYIPELAKANPSSFGISLVTTDGHVYEVGDSSLRFTIQSISKPFVYGLALEDNTRVEVIKSVGVEPTGEAFNAISLEPVTGRPRNPMINAGAIAAAGLVVGKSAESRWRRILEMLSLYAGEDLQLDEKVYLSEKETGHRNRAIGHMLRNFDILKETPEPIVDVYFKQCSVSVHTRNLAVMAATLANRGTNPITGRQAIRGEYVESVLSVMGSCGMYDYAGEWLYRVGMPAKSGVSGGLVAVLPGQLGIAVYSPALDPRGNSVRGIKVCDDLSRFFDLHLFNTTNMNKSIIRLQFSAAQINSNRVRTVEEMRLLKLHGHSIEVFQLQGSLNLSTTEVVLYEAMSRMDTLFALVLDFKHILSINESASRLLYQLLAKLGGCKKSLLFTNIGKVPQLRRYMKAKLKDHFTALFHDVEDWDTALEWCENALLSSKSVQLTSEFRAQPKDYDLFSGLSVDEISYVTGLLRRQKFKQGEVIVEVGAPAGELFFVVCGLASVSVELSGGTVKRLATFSAGMSFGEMALLDRASRSALVIANTDVECDLLQVEDFEKLGETHHRIKAVLLNNLAKGLSSKLRKANREISVFDY